MDVEYGSRDVNSVFLDPHAHHWQPMLPVVSGRRSSSVFLGQLKGGLWATHQVVALEEEGGNGGGVGGADLEGWWLSVISMKRWVLGHKVMTVEEGVQG